jgi:hypothetical protein
MNKKYIFPFWASLIGAVLTGIGTDITSAIFVVPGIVLMIMGLIVGFIRALEDGF